MKARPSWARPGVSRKARARRRRVAAMADPDPGPGRLERLERRVRELEEELARERRGRGAARARIHTMSPEVTDSNPYRCACGACGALPGAEGEQGELGLERRARGRHRERRTEMKEARTGMGRFPLLCSGSVGQCRRRVEGCSRISHLAGLDFRVTLYYLALQYRQGRGEREREREETV